MFRSTRRARCLDTKLESKLGKVWLGLVKCAPRQVRPRTQAHYGYGDMDLIGYSSHVSIIQTSLLARIFLSEKWLTTYGLGARIDFTNSSKKV